MSLPNEELKTEDYEYVDTGKFEESKSPRKIKIKLKKPTQPKDRELVKPAKPNTIVLS